MNDYLARRDTEWMGPLYRMLGLTVGTIQHDMDDAARKQAYQADIVYGTNNEFGFDYLRDHMKFALDDCVQRELHYAIVDEVDSILIDEARTPLIISGPAEQSTDLYYRIDRIIPRLKKEDDYTIDEKARSVILAKKGCSTSRICCMWRTSTIRIISRFSTTSRKPCGRMRCSRKTWIMS